MSSDFGILFQVSGIRFDSLNLNLLIEAKNLIFSDFYPKQKIRLIIFH